MSVVKSRASTGFLELTWHVRNRVRLSRTIGKKILSQKHVSSLSGLGFQVASLRSSCAHALTGDSHNLNQCGCECQWRMDYDLLSQFA